MNPNIIESKTKYQTYFSSDSHLNIESFDLNHKHKQQAFIHENVKRKFRDTTFASSPRENVNATILKITICTNAPFTGTLVLGCISARTDGRSPSRAIAALIQIYTR